MRRRIPGGAPVHPDPAPAGAAADRWIEAGPAATVRGGPLRTQRLSGCVRALVVDEGGQRLYAGSALGGVWYSADAGRSWLALDFYACVADAGGKRWPADALTVGALAVAFDADPAKDDVTVGPGARPPTASWELDASVHAVGIRRAVGPAPAVQAQGAAAVEPFRLEATDLEGVVVHALAHDKVTAGVIWAATSMGLRKRPAAGGASWPKVDAGLGSDDTTGLAVVVVAPPAAARQRWLYVAAGGKVARSLDGQAWTPVVLPAQGDGALKSIPLGPVRLVAGNVPGAAVVWALADGPRLWRIEGDKAAAVAGVPGLLSAEDQVEGLPGLCMAVSPDTDAAHQDLVVLGGASPFKPPDGPPEAALFLGKVTQQAGIWTFPRTPVPNKAQAEWVGAGVPPGLRALAWVHPAGAALSQVWAAGDGGLFFSPTDGAPGTFQERNTGLGIAEPIALGGSIATDAVALAGTRRGGVRRRLAAETWEIAAAGAAGGVAVAEADVRRQLVQRRGGGLLQSLDGGQTWSELPIFTPSLDAAGQLQEPWKIAQAAELKASPAIWRPALVAGDAAHGTQIAIGTDRVWYLDDARLQAKAGTRTGWVSLPTGDDPYDPALPGRPLRDRDKLTGRILALRWGTPDRLYALTNQGVHALERLANGSWTETRLYDREATRLATKRKTPAGKIPAKLELASLAVHDPAVGSGRLYVGTDGADGTEPLWWFDGQGKWSSAGLGQDTVVHALAVDPGDASTVYAGTDAGVWRGAFTIDHGAPAWDWKPLSLGLPQAAVVDLLLVRPEGGTGVLRAALAGRGIWELPLDGRQRGPEVYLRAHALDLGRDKIVPGGSRAPIRLDASPDVRIGRASLAPPIAPVAFAAAPAYFGADADPYDVWLVKAALLANGREVDPLTAFDPRPVVRFSRADRDLLTTHLGTLVPVPATAQAIWTAVVGPHDLPWDRGGDPADLAAWLVDEPDRFPKGRRPSTACSDQARVRVAVHGRCGQAVTASRVSVALLKAPFAGHHDPATNRYVGFRGLGGVAALSPNWAGALDADATAMRAWRAAGAVGATPALAGPGGAWSYADAVEPIRPVLEPLDPLHPQAVAFDVDLAAGLPAGDDTWEKGWLLLAVVLADDDPLAAGARGETDVKKLVLGYRHFAARSVRKAAQLPAMARSPGIDIKDYPTQGGMKLAWARSNIVWTGLYLDSPAPDPLEVTNPVIPVGSPAGTILVPSYLWTRGHNRNGNAPLPNAATAWMRAWPEIYPDFGVAPLYWGQQDPSNGDVKRTPHNHKAPPAAPGPPVAAVIPDFHPQGPWDARGPLGPINGRDAVAKAGQARLPRGAVLYVDWEVGGAPSAAAIAYLRALWREMANGGYRAGLYSRAASSSALRRECPGLFVWNVRLTLAAALPVNTPGQWRMSGGTLLLDSSVAVGAPPDADALMRQHLFDVNLVSPLPGNPIVVGGNQIQPDLDIALVHDPSFPERSPIPGEIRLGRAAAVVAAPDLAIHAVRRGRVARTTGLPGNFRPVVNLAGPAAGAGNVAFNPFVPPVALKVAAAAAGASTEWLLAFGADALGDPGVQRVQALRRSASLAWELAPVPDTGLVFDPLPGLAAASRGPDALELFAVDDDTGRVAVASFSATKGWSPLALHAGLPETVGRTSGLAVVSRSAGQLDLFWVTSGGEIHTATSSRMGVWAPPAAVPPAAGPLGPLAGSGAGVAARVHPFSRLSAVTGAAGRIDLFFVGAAAAVAPASPDWKLCVVTWRQATGWGAPVAVSMPAAAPGLGGGGIDPLAPLAACARDATHVDAFACGLDGSLLWTTLDPVAGTFSDLAVAVPGPISGIGAIEGVTSLGGNDLKVVVTARDGTVHAASWGAAGFDRSFQQVVPLDPA